MAEARVRVDQEIGAVASRPVPLPHLALVSATLLIFATVRPGTMLKIRQLSVVNVSGSAATLTLHSVPESGSVSDANAELKGFSVGANSAVDLTGLVGGLYGPGTQLSARASASSALVLHGWAEEVL